MLEEGSNLLKHNQTVVAFEGQDIVLSLPGGWKIIDELKPLPHPVVENLDATLLSALADPLGMPALDQMGLENKRILIAVDDISRPTPTHRYFGTLLSYLRSIGCRDENLLVVFAQGVHRPMSEEEAGAKLGLEQVKAIRWRNHDCRDPAGNMYVGTTSRGTDVALNRHLVEADLILCVGAIEPHVLLGYGGGLKMLLPGLASEKTIAQNHMQGVTPEQFNYVGVAESPMRLDLEEAVQMLGKTIFVINVVLNEHLDVCRFVCGDPILAHRKGAALVDSISGRDVRELADVAIVLSNPMNSDLRQSMKCIGNIEKCVKEGGLILALLSCRNGLGDVAIPSRSLPQPVLRSVLRSLSRDRILGLVDTVRRGAGVEERFLAHFSLQVVRKHRILVHSPNLHHDIGKRTGLFTQFGSIDAMIRYASRKAPRFSTAYVFPSGGITFPRLRDHTKEPHRV